MIEKKKNRQKGTHTRGSSKPFVIPRNKALADSRRRFKAKICPSSFRNSMETATVASIDHPRRISL